MDDHPKKTTDAAADDLDDKLKEARLAMEGTEHAAKREAREKTEAVHSERESIKERLAGISKEKEELELAWITLDEKRASVRQTLMPLIEEEKKIEAQEAALEEKERINVVAEERQRIEKERYETQKKRRAVEEKKWEIENSFTKEEGGLEATAKAYQKLLDEEESLYGKLDALEK